MYKILILNDLVYAGGVEKVMEEMAKFLSKREYDITIASIVKDYDNIEKYYPKNIKYICFEKAFKRTKKSGYVFKILNALKRRMFGYLYKIKINMERYDVIIALKEGECMKFLADTHAEKKYAWVHVDYNYLYWTKNIFKSSKEELECMRKYNNVVCVSKSTEESVCAILGNPGNLTIKMNPLDVNQIKKKSEKKIFDLENYKIEKDKIIFVTIGGLRHQKGYFRLLECCKKLNEEFEYELWIIGDGEDKKEMELYIKENKLSNVLLWGEQNNPYPFIRKATCFVSSSYGESYGLAIQEAIILNKPVIATTCPAFEECISSKEGYLVENTLEGLYNGLYRILSNPDMLEKYRNKEIKNYKELYINRLKEIESLWKEKE